MNPVQDFIDLLAAELTATFARHAYTVQAREPVEGELVAEKDSKQIFITTDAIDPAEDIADGGTSTGILIPVLVSCVMQRPKVMNDTVLDVPKTIALSAKVLRRRLSMVQAVQRARQQFAQTHSEVSTRFIQEKPVLIEGFLVSITGVELELNLDAEGELSITHD